MTFTPFQPEPNTYNYSWCSPDKKIIKQTDGGLTASFFVADGPEHQQLVAGNVTIAEYTEPPALTPEQKLANAGLTVDELRTLLSL